MSYRHLLVAVDDREERTALIEKAQSLARHFGARLSVLSVMPPLPAQALGSDAGMGMPVMANLPMDSAWSNELLEQRRHQLCLACAPLGIAAEDIHLVTDQIDSGIVENANALGADLIVVGHHQRRGFFSRLFSHTDQDVVGKATCDVLSVALETPPGP
ncbi:MAG: universal stress protein [Pseudomonadota bacterium]